MNISPYHNRMELAVVTCSLQQEGPLPLYEQLYRHLSGEIQSGRLASGARLPSKRALATHLGISVCTVEAAYGMLLDEGYIDAQLRRGYFVRPLIPFRSQASEMDFHARVQKPRALQPPRYDFSTSSTDASIFPYKTWVRLFRDTLYTRPELLLRGDALGDAELRETLSLFLYEYRGVRCPPDRLVIGAGVDYLLSVLLSLLPRGITVAAEDPGYQGIYRAGDRHGVRILPVPVDREGMDVPALEHSGAEAAYVTPSHQFPLGISMPIGRRTRLLSWASDQPGRYIIEDDYDSEFRYVSRPLPAMQGLDDGLKTVYIGTFSRSLAPSMRIAYMALPPDLADRYHETFIHCGDTVSRFDQQTLARFIGEGYYSRHLRRARSVYEARLKVLCAGLSDLPDACLRGHEAGLHFLLTIPSLSEEDLLSRAAARGIPLRGVSEFYQKARAPAATLVIGYAGLKDERVKEAVQELREAWGL